MGRTLIDKRYRQRCVCRDVFTVNGFAQSPRNGAQTIANDRRESYFFLVSTTIVSLAAHARLILSSGIRFAKPIPARYRGLLVLKRRRKKKKSPTVVNNGRLRFRVLFKPSLLNGYPHVKARVYAKPIKLPAPYANKRFDRVPSDKCSTVFPHPPPPSDSSEWTLRVSKRTLQAAVKPKRMRRPVRPAERQIKTRLRIYVRNYVCSENSLYLRDKQISFVTRAFS